MGDIYWQDIEKEIKEILKNADHYKNEKRDESCFLTAYQLAVLLYKNNKKSIINSTCPSNIGGKGDGKYISLSQYIARRLAEKIESGSILDIELKFFNIEGLEQFSFLDEKGILSQPSNSCFSMFRYIGDEKITNKDSQSSSKK
ncbi:hypothetical protein SDC9_162387 [bioreactor metagenome]|uniref:Uncharacterized protein n=1 Tax=bioreactor metagenome TaxID=1076179 RepID=A0A645FKX3_9ZZZZ|nr:hypothetical protein [Candidatus Metalachnospira sp.]